MIRRFLLKPGWFVALMHLSLGLFTALVFANSSLAQTVDCTNAVTNFELSYCAQADYERADAELNAVYGSLMSVLDDQARLFLRDAQRAWITYRDAECDRQADYVRGGTMMPLLRVACLADMTKTRTRELTRNPITGEPQ